MRLYSGIVGACLLVCLAAEARATVAPIFTEIPGIRGTPKAAAALKRMAGMPRLPKSPAAPQVIARGHFRAIVILLQFPPDPGIPGDSGFLADTLAHPPSAYDSLLFSVGTQPWGSLRDYYRETSGSQFDISGVVTRWYTAPRPYSYYTNGASGNPDLGGRAPQMAHDAVVLADQDLDFRQFDSNGPDLVPNSGDDDSKVDGIFVIHAGPGAEETGSEDDIYSHMSVLDDDYLSNDIGVSGPIKVVEYTTEAEKWAGLAPHTTPNLIMSIGTFCHEYGHVLGLPDLYDTSPTNTEGIGEWDLMGSGNFTHGVGEPLGASPVHFSAWSKYILGWINPIIPTTDQFGLTIPPVETGGPVYRLWTNGNLTGEYFLLENRQPIGFDRGLVRRTIEIDGVPAHGLVIYHVDELGGSNNIPTRKLVDVEEAGGPESVSGPAGVQNLDLHRGTATSQSACGTGTTVTGNRGDGYDPWPGLLLARNFSSAPCPTSVTNCGDFSQVAVSNIDETGGTITADFRVHAALVARRAPAVDDAPRVGTSNDGDGRAEPGESVLLRFPLRNLNGSPSPSLYAKVLALDALTTITAGDSIDYGTIGVAETDSGTAVEATINLAPDPIGAGYRYDVYGTAGLVSSDTVQVLLGNKVGFCDDFETVAEPWYGTPTGCTVRNEWHRESGVNHTPGGAWAWKLGAVGPIGSYTRPQDTRLISQPIRLQGSGDTLVFWHRYGTQIGTDGLSVEISTDGGATWTLLHPVPDYPFIDKWTGNQSAFAEARVPLTGYSGVVQLAFRFRAQFSGGGIGWWIDDVVVTGNATCATTGVEALPEAEYDAARSRVVVRWDLGSAGLSTVGIDRSVEGEPRTRVATLSGSFGPGSWEDLDLRPGRVHSYWLLAGAPETEYGPVHVSVPASPQAPRALGLGPVRPNPFHPEASLSISLDRDGRFALRVFRVDGTLVRTLHDGHGIAGTHPFRWDGRDDAGRTVPAGVYLIQLESGGRSRVEKAILLR